MNIRVPAKVNEVRNGTAVWRETEVADLEAEAKCFHITCGHMEGGKEIVPRLITKNIRTLT